MQKSCNVGGFHEIKPRLDRIGFQKTRAYALFDEGVRTLLIQIGDL